MREKTAGEVHEFFCAQKVSMYPEIGTAKNSCKIQPKFRPKITPKFTPPLGQKFTPPLGPKFTPPLGQILWFRGKFTEVFWALEAINSCPNKPLLGHVSPQEIVASPLVLNAPRRCWMRESEHSHRRRSQIGRGVKWESRRPWPCAPRVQQTRWTMDVVGWEKENVSPWHVLAIAELGKETMCLVRVNSFAGRDADRPFSKQQLSDFGAFALCGPPCL